MISPIFTTKRLIIRRLIDDDLTQFYDMQSNPNVMRYIKKTMNYEETKKELDRFIGYYDDDNIYFNIWAVEEINDNQLVGICGVYQNTHSEYEIAYRLRECFWRKGMGGEITKGLIKFCFEKNELDLLTAYVREGNLGSKKILENEFVFVNEFFDKKNNSLERKYQLKKETWEANKNKT